MTDDIAARLARIEALEAIRTLKHHYCRLCDEGYDAEALGALFTEDAVWDAGEIFGACTGRAAIMDFLRTMPAAVSFSAHLVMNEEIALDGDTATARWRSVLPSTFRTPDGGVPHWLFVDYEDAYRREDGVWRISLCRSIVRRMAPHAEGWN